MEKQSPGNSEPQRSISVEEFGRFVATFKKHAGTKEVLSKEDFGKMLSTKNKYFSDRAFKIFSKKNNETVGLEEYIATLKVLFENNTDGAIHFLFKVYDADGNGQLHKTEFLAALKASMEENGMNFDGKELQNLADALWEDSGVKNNATMSFPEFKQQIEKHQGLAEGLAKSITQWLIPKERANVVKKKSRFSCQNLISSYKFNASMYNFLAVFLLINVVIQGMQCYTYYNSKNYDGSFPNYYYLLARANGMCLNFNSAMLLIFILRYTITILRKMGLASTLPLDHNVYLHKFTGVLIFIQGWLHTAAHLVNLAYNVQPHPVAFLLENPEIDATKHRVPLNCTIDNESRDYNCTGSGKPYNYMQWLVSYKPGLFGLIGGLANPSGVALIVILTVMAVCSMPFVRKTGHFEIFYFTHLLYWAYFVLIILHAQRPWYFLMLPLSLFAVELMYRFITMSAGNLGKSLVTAGIVLPSKVTGLVIQKPAKFNFSPGDWVFIKIPQIATFEWHPFTISSAPEQKETFTLHIRGAGGWTNKLYSFFEEDYKRQEQSLERTETVFQRVGRSIRHRVRRGRREVGVDPSQAELHDESSRNLLGNRTSSFLKPYSNMRLVPSIVNYSSQIHLPTAGDLETGQGASTPRAKHKEQRAHLLKPLQIFIDGPYGAPASNIFRAQHAVLVASGIGVTPFSSILQSIMFRYWNERKICPNCDHKWTDDLSTISDLKKVDFFWINREQRSFEWFFQLLTQLEVEQAEKGGMMERFLDIHMFITAALEKTDMRAVGLQLAMDLLYKKEKRDLVTGLKARTQAGRPNWDKIFTDIKNQNKGDVTVFYCGNPQLGDVVKEKSRKFGFRFRKEVF